MAAFRFKQFSVLNVNPALKVGTDAVILGAAMHLYGTERHLLDIGTGSGVIALMAAQRLAGCGASITGIDIDSPSIQEAEQNFKDSPWSDSLRAILCPLKDYLPDVPPDLIFSNPPYYDNSLTNPDARETAARHTTTLSYRDICEFAALHLAPGGRLALILPAECGKSLLRTAASFGLHAFSILQISTTPQKPVKRIVAEFSRERAELAESRLTIMERGLYSEEYRALTKDFYLDF